MFRLKNKKLVYPPIPLYENAFIPYFEQQHAQPSKSMPWERYSGFNQSSYPTQPPNISHPATYPYGNQPYHPYPMMMNGAYPPSMQQGHYPPLNGYQPKQKGAEFIFQNPLEPIKEGEYGEGWYANQANPYPYKHPYPKQSFTHQPPTGIKSIMNSFKTQDGSLDVSKMIDTAGNMVNAVNQVSGMVKGLGGMFKV